MILTIKLRLLALPTAQVSTAIAIRRLLGALLLTTSECSSQSRRQASLPTVLLMIRSDYNQLSIKEDDKMADCELLKGCLFFNDKMPEDSGMGSIYKKNIVLTITLNVPDIWLRKNWEEKKFQ